MSKPMFSQRTRNILGAVVLVLTIVAGALMLASTVQSRNHEAIALAVAERLAVADANGDLFRHPEEYFDVCAGQLQAKLQLQSAQVVPQMDAMELKATLLSLNDTEVERQGDSYIVKVHATVHIEMQGAEPKDLEGIAAVTVGQIGDQWLATDYQSFQEK